MVPRVTPSQHLARIRRDYTRVRALSARKLAAQDSYAEGVEAARAEGVSWQSICAASGGQAEPTIRQKLREAAARREKREAK